MPNEIKIIVRSVDETNFGKIKGDANKTFSDIEGEAKKSGRRVGTSLGDDAATQLRDSKGRFAKVGEELGEAVAKSTASGAKAGMPSLLQFAAIAGTAMSPILGGLLAAAVVGGAGALGIGGGLALAAKDPSVKSAATSLGKEVNASLTLAAGGFVPVALQSIEKVKDGFRKMLPDIQSIFSSSKGLVGPLLDGLISGTEKIVSGIRSAVSKAEPVFQALGSMASSVGGAIGDFFDNMGDHAKEGAIAVNDLSEALVGTVNAVSAAAGGLATFRGWIDDSQAAVYKFLDGLEQQDRFLHLNASGYDKNSEALELYRKGLIGAKGMSDDYAHYLKKQASASETAASATEDQTGALKDLANEMKAQTDPLFAMIKGTQDVAKKQEQYNQALKEHGPKSKEARSALNALAEAAFDLNTKAAGAAGSFNGKLTPAMQATLRKAGLTSSEIAGVESSLRQAKAAADRFDGVYTAKFNVQYRFSSTGTERTDISGHRIGGYMASGGIAGAASGATSSGLTWVGEHGPELVKLPAGTSVKSNPDSMRLAGGGGSSGPVRIVLSFDPSRAPEAMAGLMSGLRGEIRSQGGNVQVVLGQ